MEEPEGTPDETGSAGPPGRPDPTEGPGQADEPPAPEAEPGPPGPGPEPDAEPQPEPQPDPSGPEGDKPPHPVRQALDPVIGFHQDHPIYFWIAVAAVVGVIFGVGATVAPEAFVHDFLWENFWGPTEADAVQDGFATRYGRTVSEDYTLLSEVIYGLILAGALASIYVHIFRKRDIRVDGPFIASLLPYVAFGPLARVLEDASVFCELGVETTATCEPGMLSWLFISPFIYVLTAAAVLTHLLLAHATRHSGTQVRLQVMAAWLGVQAAIYAALFYGARDQFAVMIGPVTFVALCAVAFAFYWVFSVRRGGEHRLWATAAWGLPMTLTPIVLIATWAAGSEWVSHAKALAPEVIPVVLGLTLIVLAIVVAISWFLRKDIADFAFFLVPLNLGLIAGHMIDGFATFAALCSTAAGSCSGARFLGLSVSGYGEKHPVSEFFLGFADGWGFPIMKLLLVTVIILLIDRSARDGDEDPDLIGLVKLAVLILGLGPGLRDLARVAMGV